MLDCEPCNNEEPIIIAPSAETLVCRKCGCKYASRGKTDIGICRECERTLDTPLVGGFYDGMRNSGLLERYE